MAERVAPADGDGDGAAISFVLGAVTSHTRIGIRPEAAASHRSCSAHGNAAASLRSRRCQRCNDHAIRQIVSRAVATDQIVDIFVAAGLKQPDISILSDGFLAEVRDMPQRNLAVELLQKLLKGEIRSRAKRNVVQGRSFTEMLEQTLRRYHNRAIETARVIEELIAIAKDIRAAGQRGE